MTLGFLLRTLCLALGLGLAAGLSAQYAPMPAPSRPGGKETKKAAASEEPIKGVAVARKDGRWLGLAIEDGNFKLRFYNKDKKPEKSDAAGAAVRWTAVNRKGEQHAGLAPAGDGLMLTSSLVVTPPFNFKAYVTLLDPAGQAGESFAIDLLAP